MVLIAFCGKPLLTIFWIVSFDKMKVGVDSVTTTGLTFVVICCVVLITLRGTPNLVNCSIANVEFNGIPIDTICCMVGIAVGGIPLVIKSWTVFNGN